MYNSKKENTEKLIAHIENNLYEELNTSLLSSYGFVSHTQLYRDFYSATGHSVKEYIRKRRLSNALSMLKASDFHLADIAYSCGYSSQQALCRTVKAATGMTPLQYRQNDLYYFYPPYNGKIENHISVSTETIPETTCINFYDTNLIGIEDRAVSYLFLLAPGYTGRIFGRNGPQTKKGFCYELYLTGAVDNISHFKKEQFNAVFACTLIRNNSNAANSAWDYLYNIWLPASMFEYTGEPYFEEFLINKNGVADKLKLYLPVKKNNDYLKIKLERIPPARYLVSAATGTDAERASSKAIINYMSNFCPSLLNSAKEYYLQKNTGSCVSGVSIYNETPVLSKPSAVRLVDNPSGLYAVLYADNTGDYYAYRDMLLFWARDNGIAINGDELYCVYNVTNGFSCPSVRFFCPVNMVQNDNTPSFG